MWLRLEAIQQQQVQPEQLDIPQQLRNHLRARKTPTYATPYWKIVWMEMLNICGVNIVRKTALSKILAMYNVSPSFEYYTKFSKQKVFFCLNLSIIP